MAHSLRLKVIAEGVETGDQLDLLRSLGCDQFQGYYFSTPVNARDARRFMALLPGDARAVAGVLPLKAEPGACDRVEVDSSVA